MKHDALISKCATITPTRGNIPSPGIERGATALSVRKEVAVNILDLYLSKVDSSLKQNALLIREKITIVLKFAVYILKREGSFDRGGLTRNRTRIKLMLIAVHIFVKIYCVLPLDYKSSYPKGSWTGCIEF